VHFLVLVLQNRLVVSKDSLPELLNTENDDTVIPRIIGNYIYQSTQNIYPTVLETTQMLH